MRKSLALSIPRPCSERWDEFTPANHGRFCSSCQKVIVDFTKASDDDIRNFFKNSPIHSCGRFRPDQLKTYSDRTPLTLQPGLTLFKASLLSLLIVLTSRQVSAQNTTLKSKTEIGQYTDHTNDVKAAATATQPIVGIITSLEDGQPLPGVNVVLKGTTTGAVSNQRGEFTFEQNLKEGDILVVSFIGLETMEYTISKNAFDKIAIPMKISLLAFMGEVAIEGVYNKKYFSLRRTWATIKKLF